MSSSAVLVCTLPPEAVWTGPASGTIMTEGGGRRGQDRWVQLRAGVRGRRGAHEGRDRPARPRGGELVAQGRSFARDGGSRRRPGRPAAHARGRRGRRRADEAAARDPREAGGSPRGGARAS